MTSLALPQSASTQTVRQFVKVCAIRDGCDRNPAKLIPILPAVQEE